MEREHIIKEIYDLAERIKANTSDTDSLLTDVAHLYEMVILLKHLPEEVNTNGQSSPVISEYLPIQKEETKDKSLRTPSEEKPQVTMDLFSVEINHASEKIETPLPAPTPKASPSQKKMDESVAEKLQHKKIFDLKSVIGINEKFQFINELFEGSMNEYNVALDQINNFSSLGEAVNYLANLKEMYKWNPDNPIAINFEELVQRR